jgi:catechol 2,3-dioxygenase-like lactoylglutathione lyase family enzyme
MIKEANVTIMVSDMSSAIKFYTETLGLRLKTRYGEEFAQVEAPGTIIALHPDSRSNAKAGSSGPLSIGFAVDDLDSTIVELKSKGVVFSRVSDDAQVTLAFFTDPDGTPLYLSHSKWG